MVKPHKKIKICFHLRFCFREVFVRIKEMAALQACSLRIMIESCGFLTIHVEEHYFRMLTNSGIMTPDDIRQCSEEKWESLRGVGLIKPFHIFKLKRASQM